MDLLCAGTFDSADSSLLSWGPRVGRVDFERAGLARQWKSWKRKTRPAVLALFRTFSAPPALSGLSSEELNAAASQSDCSPDLTAEAGISSSDLSNQPRRNDKGTPESRGDSARAPEGTRRGDSAKVDHPATTAPGEGSDPSGPFQLIAAPGNPLDREPVAEALFGFEGQPFLS